MTHRVRTITAAEFNAKCLDVLNEVADTGARIVVTRLGKPLVRIEPLRLEPSVDLRGSVTREVHLIGDASAIWSADTSLGPKRSR